MNTRRTAAVLFCLFPLFSGCSTNPSKQEIGTVTGAVVGGVAGSVLTGGSTWGTVTGASAGALVGGKLGKDAEVRR